MRLNITRDAIPVYLLPGMTPEHPVYSQLAPTLPNSVPIKFITPLSNESITSYAARMAMNLQPDSFLVGVSFGGILAIEMFRILRPQGCVLISSISSPNQLPPWFRAWRPFGGRTCSRLLRCIGDIATIVPQTIRTPSTMRVTKLSGSGGHWHRWATAAVVDWQCHSESLETPTLHIHGAKDMTFPIRYVAPDVVIPFGNHAISVTHADDIANSINKFIQKTN